MFALCDKTGLLILFVGKIKNLVADNLRGNPKF